MNTATWYITSKSYLQDIHALQQNTYSRKKSTWTVEIVNPTLSAQYKMHSIIMIIVNGNIGPGSLSLEFLTCLGISYNRQT